MSKIYLGLGSNLGPRHEMIEKALQLLQEVLPEQKLKISPLYETPALLLESADPSWNKPFLNLVVQGVCREVPHALLQKIKKIEKQLGRTSKECFSPRTIDIDILIWEGVSITSKDLSIPHPSLKNRAFVLDPLKDLEPRYMQMARLHPQHSPLWMGILNVTPDSFSDGGKFLDLREIDRYLVEIENHVGVIDVGAESTRPGATSLTAEEEWTRLEGVLKHLQKRYFNRLLKPLISVDTRHSEVAKAALELGVDMINDVSGFSDLRMGDVLKKNPCQYVLMHSLCVPADPQLVLPAETPTIDQIVCWFKIKLKKLEEHGIFSERVILDPGIGFGKTGLQSLEILRNIKALNVFPCRVLVGHSRKSLIKDFSPVSVLERDVESIGMSLNLAQKGVDLLRVHNPMAHIRAFRASNHLNQGVI